MLVNLISIGLFPVVILLILYINNRKSGTVSTDDWLFNAILLALAYFTFMSFASWVPDGHTFAGARTLLWTLNLLYFVPLCLLPGLWMMYVRSKLGGAALMANPRRMLACLAPLLVLLLMTLSTPWTKLVFYIDGGNRYQRGILYWLPYIVFTGYMVYTMLFAMARARSSAAKTDKNRAYLLACFAPLTVLGMLLQAAFYGLWLGWPLCSLSAVIIAVGIQNRRITTDALTGLNNRRELERYIVNRLKQGDSAKPWGLFFLDVDHFKHINDRFGHLTGDDALKLTAEVLRAAFGDGGGFLSRCGGDEFAVAVDCADEDEAERFVRRLRREAKRADDGTLYSYDLSVGYALARKGMDAESLIGMADMAMYADKKRVKRAETN